MIPPPDWQAWTNFAGPWWIRGDGRLWNETVVVVWQPRFMSVFLLCAVMWFCVGCVLVGRLPKGRK